VLDETIFVSEHLNLTVMKSVFFLFCLFVAPLNSFAQGECPPVAWCHPDGEGLGYPYTSFLAGMTAAADAIGKVMNGDGCEGANYAEMVYCYPAKWLTDVLPCMYGKDTPQATLCDEGGGSGGSGGEEPEGQSYTANPGFTPFYTTEPKAKGIIKKFLDKKKRGDIIARMDKGITLRLKSKFYTNKKKTEYTALMELVNSKGQIIGRPIMISKGPRMYVHDLIPKKNKTK
jgi:hypothetical protein